MKYLEKQLFNWKLWDSFESSIMLFRHISLLVKIGDFEIGTQFECAEIHLDSSTLRLYKNQNDYEFFEFNLVLTAVGPGRKRSLHDS